MIQLIPKDEVFITKLLCDRLSSQALSKLEDFLTTTTVFHKKTGWPPIVCCVRAAQSIKEFRRCLKKAKTPEDRRLYTAILRGLETGKIGKK